MITREILADIKKSLFRGEAVVVVGPRQVGKTTLVETLLRNVPADRVARYNGDYLADRRDFPIASAREADARFSGVDYIMVDEAQKIPDVGDSLKILVDRFGKAKQVIVTGSSTLGLLDHTSEPLTGRKRTYRLFPLSFSELVTARGQRDARATLEETMVFGSYPQVVSQTGEAEKIRKLEDLVSGQLYRDILEFQDIKNPDVLARLLELLALRVGSEVSYHALAQILGVSQQTVEKYVDLLEKSFVVFRVRPHLSNKGKEVSKMKKVYFYDLGIRNAILRSFGPLRLRTDVGALWENFFILERRKNVAYRSLPVEQRFWRTKAQEEVDYLEMGAVLERAFECKWGGGKYSPPQAFTNLYPGVSVTMAHPGNALELLK